MEYIWLALKVIGVIWLIGAVIVYWMLWTQEPNEKASNFSIALAWPYIVIVAPFEED